jgi:hypothetical protein
MTAMGGALLRTPDGWQWRDHTPEPRVRDLTAAEAFQFDRVIYPDGNGGRERWVSIPVRALDDEPDIAEMVRNRTMFARNSEHDPGRIEVREVLWDEWALSAVVGVIWEAEDESDLLAKAASMTA